MKSKSVIIALATSLFLLGLVAIGLVACGGETTTTTTSAAPSSAASATTSQPAAAGGTALTITKGTETVTHTLADIEAMTPVEGWGGIMNSSGVISGPFRQKGVGLLGLLDEVGGITDGDAIRITAKDGYSMTYSYDQIANGNFTTLDCSDGAEVPHDPLTVILSYEEDGTALSDQIGPLRIAILNGDTQVTEGHWWIKWVQEIEIVPFEASWSLHLEGVLTEDIDSNTFESCAAPGCHGASWTDDQGRVWEGIPLWFLAGRIDDENNHSKDTQAFNDAAADAGYELTVTAADGYAKTFASADIKRNNDYIVSFRRDGEPLPDNQWPLRLVGPNLTKGEMVGQIADIVLSFGTAEATGTATATGTLPAGPVWSIHLEGALAEDVDNAYLNSCLGCHGTSWTDDDGHLWQGVPLWLFAGRVDDDFKHNQNQPGAFNDDVAAAGYQVEVVASDGYSKTFESADIARNDAIFVAFVEDGQALPEDQWPARLVGPTLTKGQMVGMIAEILVILP